MRRAICAVLCLGFLIFVGAVPVAARDLVPVGEAVSLRIQTDGVYVVKFDADPSPARAAGLRDGDRILQVDGRDIDSVSGLREAVRASGGGELIFCVRRGERPMSFTVRPENGPEGWQVGVFVRDQLSGVGTVTWYDPETGVYGALGHGIGEGGELLPIRSGEAGAAEITGVLRGEAGSPGALRAAAGEPLATVEKNTPCGVFGRAEAGVFAGEAVPAASAEQVRPGEAEILCCVEGTAPVRYAVVIESLRPTDREGRDLTLRITDPRLLEKTGGIVQGMSGSPILQDGRLVGAVTHVLIRDPTRGYGVLIGHMLEAAGGGN